MDALALLCTLHADGPATLRRLRAAGCDSLAALEAIPADQLGELLHVTPAVARRLEREARALRARVDDDPLEREEAPEGLLRGSLGAAATEETTSAASLDQVDQELLGRVLDTVREAPEVQAEALAPVEPLAEADPIASSDPAGELLPEGPEGPEGPDEPAGLRAGAVDGLDAELCVELARAEVRDLEALVRADCDDLARRTGRSFAQLRRLQFLARRQLPREPQRLEPRAPFGAGVPKPVVGPAASPEGEAPSTPAGAAPGSEPPPFGANIVDAIEPVIPTRQRTEAPGMEHPVPVEPTNTSPRRFWEPRSIYEARTGRKETPEAGEIGAGAAVERPAAEAPAPPATPAQSAPPAEAREPQDPRSAAAPAGGGEEERAEVLRWNFEIPAPGSLPESIAAPDRRRSEGEGEREDAAGPFA